MVLNRVEYEQFPDTVKDVIYQKNAFEPVQNGSFNEQASNEAVQAVETATSQWIFSREVVKKIGNHAFAI